MTQEHENQLDSERKWFKDGETFGYSLAEAHYQAIIDKLREGLGELYSRCRPSHDPYYSDALGKAKQLLSETEPK